MVVKYNPMVKKRLEVLRLAKKLGNVAEACRQCGVSRPFYYRWKPRYDKYGVEGLKDLSRAHKSHPQTKKEPVVNEIKQLWRINPNYNWVAYKLNDNGTKIVPSTVREIVLYRV